MKKSLILLSVLALAACATTKDKDNGLTKLDSEPKDCEFLYTLDSSIATYKLSDANEFLEKSILEQKNYIGDSYYIVDESILDNAGAIFGPEHTYKFKVKVYKCNK